MKKVTVNKEVCIGCGACMQIAGDVFGYDDSGLSKVKVDTVQDDNGKVIMAAESCPTGAISIEDSAEAEREKCNSKDECDCGEDCTCNHECDCHKN